MKRLGIDVDLVVLQSDKVWDEWLMSKCGLSESLLPKKEINYNLGLYYKETLPKGLNPMDFWRQEDLYQDVPLVKDSLDSINELSNYYNLVFITAIKGNHHKSKYYFIKNLFPHLTGFVATKEKYLVNVDIMIDDRAKNLDPFSDSTDTILFETPYIQEESTKQYTPMDWKKILLKLRGN